MQLTGEIVHFRYEFESVISDAKMCKNNYLFFFSSNKYEKFFVIKINSFVQKIKIMNR